MLKVLFKVITISSSLLYIPQASAHMIDSDHHNKSGVHIILAEKIDRSETKELTAKQNTKNKLMDGPQKSKGIKKVKVVGKFPLKGQFKDINLRELRTRYIEIEPGGIVGVHRHGDRPGPAIAYIISGELTEFRKGDAPVVKKPGDTALEPKGTIHWWRNDGSTIAKALVVDIPLINNK
jgi:quercetin dioxygenase-like cupin family protein